MEGNELHALGECSKLVVRLAGAVCEEGHCTGGVSVSPLVDPAAPRRRIKGVSQRRIDYTKTLPITTLSTSATATTALFHALPMFLGGGRLHFRTDMAYTLAARRLHNLQLKLGITTLCPPFQLWHRKG
jgi:hypothetical protein